MYNRLFTKILDSSIWLEPTTTRIVWVTLLAAMDEDGVAHFSAVENLAARARVTIQETEKAIQCFVSPDKNSGDPDNEGRRIERIPGGYLILNAAKYREIFSREIQRERTRVRVARHRASKRSVTHGNDLKQSVTQSEAYSEACTEEGGKGNGAPRLPPFSVNGTGKISGHEAITREKELHRVEKAISLMRRQYGGDKWPASAVAEIDRLKLRRKELLAILGMSA